jgi:hypothetical protein
MIKRVFSFLILVSLQAFASQYDSTVIDLEAKLFPKIILMNQNIDKNSTQLNIYIISQKIDFDIAKDFQETIESYYPKKLMGKKIIVTIKEFEDFKKRPDAIIVLYHCKSTLKKIALWANTHKIISLAYDPSYMDENILASLYIGKSTKPCLNKKIIKKYNFIFNPYLLQLSKFK